MKKLLFLAMLVTGFTSCDSDDNNNNQPFTPVELEFEVILQGYQTSSSVSQQQTVITNQNELVDLIGNNLHPNLANFDFENYQLATIFGETSYINYGYYIVEELVEYEYEIAFNYKYYYDPVGGVYDYPNRPWIFVKIPKSNKPVIFEMEEVLIED